MSGPEGVRFAALMPKRGCGWRRPRVVSHMCWAYPANSSSGAFVCSTLPAVTHLARDVLTAATAHPGTADGSVVLADLATGEELSRGIGPHPAYVDGPESARDMTRPGWPESAQPQPLPAHDSRPTAMPPLLHGRMAWHRPTHAAAARMACRRRCVRR